MDLGVFIPIANNGWLISKTSPQYNTSFALNRDVTLLAEKYGFEFSAPISCSNAPELREGLKCLEQVGDAP